MPLGVSRRVLLTRGSLVGVGMLAAASVSVPSAAAATPTGGGAATAMPMSQQRAASAAGVDAATDGLRAAFSVLMGQHMEWTYATIAALAAGSRGLTATLARLQRNQDDIGSAFGTFYGKHDGQFLAALLHQHIDDCVVLFGDVAGQLAAGRELAAVERSDPFGKNAAATYANARAIGDFFSRANPSAWPRATMEKMLTTHIDQTVVYGNEQLTGDFAGSIRDYGVAETHMAEMGTALADGIAQQLPGRVLAWYRATHH